MATPTKAVITSVGGAIGGGTSNNSQPVINGTAAPGTYVNVYDGVRMIGTATVAANGTWSFTAPAALKGGTHSFTAIDVGSDGSYGSSSIPMSVVIPAATPVAPAKPIINGMTDDAGHPIVGPTNDPHPSMSGTGKPGDTITMYDGPTPIGSTIIGPDGKWVVKPTTDLSNGTHDIYVIETSPAGVPSVPSDHYPVVIDTSTPAKPIIDGITDDTGTPIPSGNPTGDTKPHMEGTGKPGDTITMYDGPTPIGSTIIGPDGKWSVEPTNPLIPGTHDLYVIETSPGGTPSTPSDHYPVVIDTSAPPAPIITGLSDTHGLIPTGGTTADTHPSMSGTGKAGDIVTLYDGGKAIGSVTVGADGKWTIKPTADLSNGTHDVYAIEKNPAGAQSQASTHTTFTVDTHPVTTTPVITSVIDAVGPVTGNVPTGGTTDDTMPTINGTGKPGELVYLYDGTRGCGDTIIDANGNWSIQIKSNAPLTNAEHHITAYAKNSAGVWSLVSNDWAVTVDTHTPSKPIISGTTDDHGLPITPGGATVDPRPSMSGTGTPGDTITMYDGPKPIGSTTVGPDGKWVVKPTQDLQPGTHDLYVIETSPAGVPSTPSDHTAIVVDTGGPATPIITSVIDAVGPVLGNIPSGGTTDDTRPTLKGTGRAGDVVTVYDGTDVMGSATVDGSGNWSIQISTARNDGKHDLLAKAKSPAGVTSDASNVWTITVDTSTPAAPTIASVMDNVGSIKGAIAAGGVTDDARPVISGTGKAGDLIKLYDGATLIGSVTVGTDGKWSVQPDSALSNAAHYLTAIDTNAAGKPGPASAGFNFTVDTTTPATPTAPVITDNGATIPSGGSMFDGHPVISGTGKAGDTIKVYDGSTVIGSVTIGGDGKWSFKPTTDLSYGAHDLSVIETNLAGTSSAASAHVTFTVVVPAPVITDIVDAVGLIQGTVPDGGMTDDLRPTISGTGVAGNTVYIFANGSRGVGDMIIDGTGHWSMRVDKDLVQGLNSITATQFPSGQPQSAASNTWTITVDTSVPVAPTIASVMDNVGTITGAIKGGGMTDDTRPVVNGTGKAGDIVRLYDGSTMIGSVKVGSDGKWTIQPANALSNAAHDLYATDTNLAGTTSLASAHFGFTVNTIPPATPAVPVITDNGSLIPPGGTMYDGHPVITGSGTSGDTIKVYDGSTVIGSTTIGSDGKWSFTPSTDLSSGSHDLYVIETNAAGTASAPSTHISFSVVPGPLETVTITNLIDHSSGSNVSIPNGASTVDKSPTVQGTISSSLLAGETVVVYRDGVKVGTATVNGTNWSYGDSNMSIAPHTYTARVETASTQGKFSAPFSFTELQESMKTGVGFTGDPTSPTVQVRVNPSWNLSDLYMSVPGANAVRISYKAPDPSWMRPDYIALIGTNTWQTSGGFNTKGMSSSTVISIFGYDAQNHPIAVATFTVGWLADHISAPAASQMVTPSVFYDFPHTVQSVLKAQSAVETSIDDQSHASSVDASQPEHHTVVGEHDAFKGTAGGLETVDLNADPTSYFKEATAHIEGAKGGAVDTLHLTGDHQILDLTSLTGKTAAAKISGIEVIDLGGQHNTLKLSLVDVLNLGETDLFQQDGKQQLMVNGKEGDVVDLSNSHVAGLAEGEWQQHGTSQVGGVTYNVYEHSGAHTELLVQQGVQIAVH
jgi:hypothetical protein